MTEQKKSLKKEKKCLELSKTFFKFVRVIEETQDIEKKFEKRKKVFGNVEKIF